MEPGFGSDVDPVYGVTIVVEVVLNGNGACVGYDRFTGIATGDEGDDGLHGRKIILAK
jgi:hypothetical protein